LPARGKYLQKNTLDASHSAGVAMPRSKIWAHSKLQSKDSLVWPWHAQTRPSRPNFNLLQVKRDGASVSSKSLNEESAST
jgi:hypothetical protein